MTTTETRRALKGQEHTQSRIVEGIDVVVTEDPSFSPVQREYLRNRWLHEVSYFAKATRRSRRLHFFVSVVAVASGALTACAAGLNVFFDNQSIRWLIAGMGVITAISTGLSTRFQDWENWKRRSMTLERLKSEGRMFLLLSGPYQEFSSAGEAFKTFAQNLEGIVKEYKTEFFAKRPDQETPRDSGREKR
jgi:hypothetical protein